MINGMQVSSHRGSCIPRAAIGQGLDNVFVFNDNFQSVGWHTICQMSDTIPNRLDALYSCPYAFEPRRPSDKLVESLVIEEKITTVA